MVHRRRAATRSSGMGRRPSRTTTEVMATRLSIHAWISSGTTAAWIRASSARTWRTVERKRPARSSSIRGTIFFISSRVRAGQSATASASAAPASPGQARTRFRQKRNGRTGRHPRKCSGASLTCRTSWPGGPNNPLGARALYLGSTLYRIHGSNEPWTIGQNVSSGCIRMRNADVIDLYERVKVGTKVVVL